MKVPYLYAKDVSQKMIQRYELYKLKEIYLNKKKWVVSESDWNAYLELSSMV